MDWADIQEEYPGLRQELGTKAEEQHYSLALQAVCWSVAHRLSTRVEEPSPKWSQVLQIAHVVPR